MKKVLLTVGAAAVLSISAFAAGTTTVRPVGELLGLKAGNSGFFTSGVVDAASRTPLRAPEVKNAENGEVNICASVVYPEQSTGMWSFSVSDYNPTRLSLDRELQATGGGIAANGMYYFNRYMSMLGLEEIKTFSYKIPDWSQYDSYTGKINYVATTMAYCSNRDEVYGCFINENRDGYKLVRWKYDSYLPGRAICDLPEAWSGCAFSSDDTLYAIDRKGDLYTVDIKTGEMTLVGSTGLVSNYVSDAIIDTDTDKMYWCVASDDVHALYEVNIKTGAATKLYDLSNEEQLCGMYIDSGIRSYADDTPARISSVSTSFSTAQFSGTVSFYTPRLSRGNTALPTDEELSYTVRANGKIIATGSSLPNKRVNAAVTLEESDNYYFTVTTTNVAGESEACGTHKYVGIDQPQMTGALNIRLSGSNATLSWSRVSSTGLNGGSVDNYSAVYTVVRHPDMKVVADAISTTSVTDELPAPEARTEYWYTLTAKVGELETNTLSTTTLALGPITPPFEGLFDSYTSVAGWTLIDVAADDYKWTYYNSDKALQLSGSRGFDDWAISPAVKVRKGISYPVTITLQTSGYRDETFEVKWGAEPTAEAMTNTLIESTTFKSTTAVEYRGELVPAEDGKVYIGIHGCTASPSSKINVLSVKIEGGQSSDAPAAPADFKVSTPVDGTREANISFTLPAQTVGGEALEGDKTLTSAVISRDGEVIATFTEDLTAGKEISYVDNSETLTLGKHLYSVVAANSYGESPAAETEVLVGARKPIAPAEAKMIEDGNTGRVTISWTPVTTDVEGNTFSADAVTYRVIDRQYNTVADNVSGTSVTITAVEEGEQAFCQFGVYAVTAGGESDKMTGTAYKPVGKPYTSPWNESFADGSISSIFGYNFIKGNEPWQFISNSDWGIVPQDEDRGFAYLESYGDLTALVTGKIDLEGLNSPAFTYYTFNYEGSSVYSNSLTVEVDNGDGRGFVAVQKNVVAETGPFSTWNKVVVPLDNYDGQSVIFRIVPGDLSLAFYTLDNLRVTSYVENNLSAGTIEAPGVAENGKSFEINFTVSNNGENPINSYTVELWKNGDMADYKECTRIEPNESKSVVFEQTLTALDGEDVTFHAVVVCDNDGIESDNTSAEITVANMAPAVPFVRDLSAVPTDNSVELSWSAPDLSEAAPAPFTENFDAAESWTNNIDGWKFIDVDKAPFGGINTLNYPCNGMQSWYVADNTWSGIQTGDEPARWDAHSGNKYIVSAYVMRGQQNVQSDDWAITPQLNGNFAQVISFYAKSFDPKYLESFEVLASAGTTSTDDFVSVGTAKEVPNSWRQYRFKLPAGTRYAAVRSRSINKFLLFVDDITYVPASGEPEQLSPVGYNVYRNGVKLNAEPIAEPTFTDEKVINGRDYIYVVTVVYDGKGESAASNAVSVLTTGAENIGSASDVTIRTAGNSVVVTGLTTGAVTVISPDGRCVATAEAAPVVTIPLAHGVYIVNAGNTTAKVVIK